MISLRSVGTTSLELSEIGFGAASVGNLYRPVAADDARAALDAAINAGITYVDTAPRYGHGLSERRVGDAVRERDGVILSTKVGRLLRPDASLRGDALRHGFRSPMPFEQHYDYSYDGIMRSWEDSLQRLGLAAVDILYVHDIGRMTHGEANTRFMQQLIGNGGFRALAELRKAGAIRAFGLGVNEWEVCIDAFPHADPDVVLLAGRYSLLEQTALTPFFDICLARGVSVVIGGAYNSGILATGTRGGGTIHYDYGVAPPDIVERVRRIEAVCDAHGVPLAAAALQFPLAHPVVASVVVGLGSVGRVDQTLALYRHTIPAELWSTLRGEGLIDPRAPVPGDS